MRKYLFILITIVLTSKAGFGQNNVYYPFPDSNGVWNFHYMSSNYNGYYSYGIFGDTIINSLTYGKLYGYSMNIYSRDSVMTESNSDFIGGFREDSINRIYLLKKNYNSGEDAEYLLYDFSKHVSDTILFGETFRGYTYPYLVLESIDSVLVNDTYRKRYNLQGETWIEGIGSTRDLLSSIIPIPTCYCVHEIVCYKYGDTTYYLDSKFHDCYPFFGNSIKDVLPAKSVIVSPNPIVSQAFLTTDMILNNAILTFYSSFGQRIKQIEDISGQTITIYRDNLPVGLYFISLTQGNKLLWTGKIEVANN